MKNKLKKINWINKRFLLIIGILSVALLAYLTILNIFIVCRADGINGESNMVIQGQYFFDICLAILFAGLLMLFTSKIHCTNKNLLLVVMLWCILLGVFFVALWHPILNADSTDLWRYVVNIDGESPDYILMYPNNLGYLSIMIIANKIFTNPMLGLILINLVFLLISVYALYRIAILMFGNERVTRNVLVILAAFVPLTMEILFMYNDIIGIGLAFVALWQALEFRKTNGIKNIVGLVLAASFAILIRQNALIVLIAIVVFLLCTLKKNNILKTALVFVLVLAVNVMLQCGIQAIYQAKMGWDFSDQEKKSPAIAWIAMGFGVDKEEWGVAKRTPEVLAGWWNGYNRECVVRKGSDCANIAKEDLNRQLGNYIDEPAQGFDFFHKKIASQWAEPTFQTPFFAITSETPNGTTQKDLLSIEIEKDTNIYNSRIKLLAVNFHYDNIVHLMIIGLTAVGFTYLLKLKEMSWQIILPMIVVMGYFCFSLIWEAKSRYIIMVFPLLLTYAAYGLDLLAKKYHDRRASRMKME